MRETHPISPDTESIASTNSQEEGNIDLSGFNNLIHFKACNKVLLNTLFPWVDNSDDEDILPPSTPDSSNSNEEGGDSGDEENSAINEQPPASQLN